MPLLCPHQTQLPLTSSSLYSESFCSRKNFPPDHLNNPHDLIPLNSSFWKQIIHTSLDDEAVDTYSLTQHASISIPRTRYSRHKHGYRPSFCYHERNAQGPKVHRPCGQSRQGHGRVQSSQSCCLRPKRIFRQFLLRSFQGKSSYQLLSL